MSSWVHVTHRLLVDASAPPHGRPPPEAAQEASTPIKFWRWHARYLLANQKPLARPQVLPLVTPPATPEVAQEDITHEAERRQVNTLFSLLSYMYKVVCTHNTSPENILMLQQVLQDLVRLYRVFNRYCVHSEGFKIFQTLIFLCFPSVLVCVHIPGR